MGAYRLVLADDHTLFRQGLKKTLEGEPGLKVIGEAGDGLELLSLLAKLTPDAVLLDISMPNLQGIETIPEIKKSYPHVKILVLTMHKEKEFLFRAIAIGADGYFVKSEAETELFSAIQKIRQGETYVSPHFSAQPVMDWEGLREGIQTSLLTGREIEVLKLIAEGKSNKEIADLLFISVHTAHRHRANMMEKLHLRKTADLVKYAIQKGYI